MWTRQSGQRPRAWQGMLYRAPFNLTDGKAVLVQFQINKNASQQRQFTMALEVVNYLWKRLPALGSARRDRIIA